MLCQKEVRIFVVKVRRDMKHCFPTSLYVLSFLSQAFVYIWVCSSMFHSLLNCLLMQKQCSFLDLHANSIPTNFCFWFIQQTKNKSGDGTPKTCLKVTKGLVTRLFSQVYGVYSETLSFCLVPYFTHQVNKITEVLLNLLGRQTPHQIQGTIQLLIILRNKKILEIN